jgi:uncharacterized protein (TIGR02118 family)
MVMKKVVFVLFRKAALTHEQCMAQWNGQQHTSIVRRVPGLRRWVQNQVTEMPSDTAADGIGELWFDDAAAMERGMNSPPTVEAVEDAKRFLDMEKTYALMVDEKTVVGSI